MFVRRVSPVRTGALSRMYPAARLGSAPAPRHVAEVMDKRTGGLVKKSLNAGADFVFFSTHTYTDVNHSDQVSLRSSVIKVITLPDDKTHRPS